MRPMSQLLAPLGVLLPLVVLAPLAGCGGHHEGSGHHEAHGAYAATRPLRSDTTLEREYVAQIQAIQHIEVRALERGYVDDIYVDEGQEVSKGDRMFQVLPRVYEAELQRAAAEAQFASIEYDNTRALADGHVVSPNELKLAQARRDKAHAEQALAQAHLDLARIEAPFDGIMGRLEVRRGSLVEEGELLTTLADNHKVWVYFNVTEAEYLDYRRRMNRHDPFEVQLRLANGEMFEHPGLVETIEADFDNETGTIAFRATFPNPDGLLRHGETGNIVVTTPLKDAMIIPQKATFSVLDKTCVYVVDEEGIAHQREIAIKASKPHVYLVEHGLEDDERILIDGLRKVRDGHEVATVYQTPEDALAKLALHAE